ncbi:hypothetical protein [Gryllotalpicola ginsengisoli]|uniref:hypothetical protein n=1 Tax=Gryllotalpicola ginsengisoli TaxID=444608 RepID=UPI0003B61E03|nr:hypothetical protein [Gryllotalpicola ginsengisoli]
MRALPAREQVSPSRPRAVIAVLAAVLLAVLTLVPAGQSASALSGSDFDPGEIISDDVFFDTSTMSAASIQSFLGTRESGCASTTGSTPCLYYYKQSTPTKAATTRCAQYPGSASESAAAIVYKVAVACGINPQVLLVTLQKEQGLVTSKAPTSYMYRSAMGYGCPDTAACDSLYYGFFNQVYGAANQFKLYGQYAAQGSYVNYNGVAWRIGQNQILYSPTRSCGAKTVDVKNQATLDLYIYTPYTPNAAALANLGGTGDGCSAYGNRNFWVWFNNWFGDPVDSGNPPFGAFDSATALTASVRVRGWVSDPDTTNPTNVKITVDGASPKTVRASVTRTDVAAVYPEIGARHGFDVTFAATAGTHQICVTGLNVGGGKDTPLGCKTVTVTDTSPVGAITSAQLRPGGTLHVEGWMVDPDTSAALTVRTSIDGVAQKTTFVANRASTAAAAAYPALGSAHGFSVDLPSTEAGERTVCVSGDNVGAGSNRRIGCATIDNVPTGPPVGSVSTTVYPVPGGLHVEGWAIDPDSATPVTLAVRVDGVRIGYITANKSGTASTQDWPGWGSAHAFQTTAKASPGKHTICIYAVDQPKSHDNPQLGCVTGTVLGSKPVGMNGATSATTSGISLHGWTFDPDTTASISVRVKLDGVNVGDLAANTSRPDFLKLYPGFGSRHGYQGTLRTKVSKGKHTVCVWALDSSGVRSKNVQLQPCVTVNVTK